MKIILTSIGSRGDIEPFISIGKLLKDRGHNVLCAFPEQFRKLVEDLNITFASLGAEFIDNLYSEEGKTIMEKKGWSLKKISSFYHFILKQRKIDKELANKLFQIIETEKPDRIVYNGKSAYPVIWELENRGKTTWLIYFPYMHYVKNHSHIVFVAGNYGTIINKLSYFLVQLVLVKAVFDTKKWLNITDKLSLKDVLNVFKYGKSIYTISPTLFSGSENWSKDIKILGYQKLVTLNKWKPKDSLLDFIDKHKKILFITFGSMISSEPEKKTNIIIEMLERNKIPAIINTAAGGFIEPKLYNSEIIYFVEQIPYDWIFERVYAVIHHGGSGTTQMGLKSGCPTLIIPHFITDQSVWNKIIFYKGLGPKGINIEKITSKKLEPKIIDLFENPTYKDGAELIKKQMAKEDFTKDLINTILK